MKLTLKIAEILLRLSDGESIPASQARGELIERLISENIIYRKGKQRKTIHLISKEGLNAFLANQLQIQSLTEYVGLKANESASRADFVKLTSDSKDSKERAFKGFLVNSFQPINCTLHNLAFTVYPPKGSFQFISDYEHFTIPERCVVVGVENARNFSLIRQQSYLFKDNQFLFLSRYPQNQNKDMLRWLQQISNKYLHFGDFDLAGIGIYLHEYKANLGNRATFFIPPDIAYLLTRYGNRTRYNVQQQTYGYEDIEEKELKDLLDLIHKRKKGLDQEYFITEK